MISYKLFVRIFHFGPPSGIVGAFRLRMVVDLDAAAHEVAREGLHRRTRVYRISSAIYDEQRFVNQVVGKKPAFNFRVNGEDENKTR